MRQGEVPARKRKMNHSLPPRVLEKRNALDQQERKKESIVLNPKTKSGSNILIHINTPTFPPVKKGAQPPSYNHRCSYNFPLVRANY